MKASAVAGVVFVVTAALGMTAYAQGRHDDRPHGMRMPSAGAREGAPAPAGRHDERAHGVKKAQTHSMERAPDTREDTREPKEAK